MLLLLAFAAAQPRTAAPLALFNSAAAGLKFHLHRVRPGEGFLNDDFELTQKTGKQVSRVGKVAGK